MKYREDDLDIIIERQHESLQDLRKLQITFVSLSQQTDSAPLKEHLAQGVGFRLGVIARTIENTFSTLVKTLSNLNTPLNFQSECEKLMSKFFLHFHKQNIYIHQYKENRSNNVIENIN